ncbi:MAG: 50S ribosomal protein L13 [Parcubacteria group bacterium CG_4_10_14_0_8_um_filter_35_7]|nr:MAG: 50S ribosomal protein L13 [Parcubacteria group bacterium CG_4_10_14_0_8_um_filter_35_7]
MTLFMVQKKITRKTHTIDAQGKVLGRLASNITLILRGKNKPEFRPYVDVGDIVEVFNVDKVKITGQKLKNKKYFRYSGYPGGLKEKKMGELFKENPFEILRRAVWHMLPNNKLRKEMIKRLKHKH